MDRNDYALGGTSITSNNPSGWESIKIDLTDYVGQYVELRFVMEYNKFSLTLDFQWITTPCQDGISIISASVVNLHKPVQ